MDSIILIAQQIAKEGKQPNTALIKARLPKNVPLPTIIQGLKMWINDPHKVINIPTEVTASENLDSNTTIETLIDTKINQAIAPLIKQVELLTKQLVDLKKQLKIQEKE
ncbi:conserved hypothetical protein [Psychromonas ingrahamii 37]|uniref:KfrA N-terminal DNA-binding domain-containing protein n=1 Tax=Psychromonas ingrahamii (strain DSM 17664 / CCUG 51855 / 37) TaxID=357804 RepID=A1ST59_PSYIN|nr:hypothetical protein [Psychromonas ingrahamii]ABM02674.1 conserved hypothetical protein [Psychromonas ingrahamii 37]